MAKPKISANSTSGIISPLAAAWTGLVGSSAPSHSDNGATGGTTVVDVATAARSASAAAGGIGQVARKACTAN